MGCFPKLPSRPAADYLTVKPHSSPREYCRVLFFLGSSSNAPRLPVVCSVLSEEDCHGTERCCQFRRRPSWPQKWIAEHLASPETLPYRLHLVLYSLSNSTLEQWPPSSCRSPALRPSGSPCVHRPVQWRHLSSPASTGRPVGLAASHVLQLTPHRWVTEPPNNIGSRCTAESDAHSAAGTSSGLPDAAYISRNHFGVKPFLCVAHIEGCHRTGKSRLLRTD